MEQSPGSKRPRSGTDEIAPPSTTDLDDAASLQAVLDAMMEPGVQRLRLYAEMCGFTELMASGLLQAHAEELINGLTYYNSSLTGRGGPIEGIQAPAAVVQGVVLVCQELVATTATTRREAVSARKKLMAFAWLLADVMGQVRPWDSDVALVVGKRMERTLGSVHASLAEQKAALADALQADDMSAARLAHAAMCTVLSAPTRSALVELELPADQVQMASASLALLAARGKEPQPPAESMAAVLEAIPRLTQAELWQVVELAQDELKARNPVL